MLTLEGTERRVNCSTYSAVLTFTESGSEKNKEEYLRGPSARNLKRGPAPLSSITHSSLNMILAVRSVVTQLILKRGGERTLEKNCKEKNYTDRERFYIGSPCPEMSEHDRTG